MPVKYIPFDRQVSYNDPSLSGISKGTLAAELIWFVLLSFSDTKNLRFMNAVYNVLFLYRRIDTYLPDCFPDNLFSEQVNAFA